MQIGLIGLGRMGGNMSRRLLGGGHEVVVWDRSADAVQTSRETARPAPPHWPTSVSRLTPPRAMWLMVPAGDPTEQTVTGARRAPAAGRHHHRRRQQPFQR